MSKWQILLCVACVIFTKGRAVNEVVTKGSRRAIIVGATSGMGRQVAKVLANEKGYEVGIVGRRTKLLESLQSEIKTKSYARSFDVSKHEEAAEELSGLIEEMGGLDLIFISLSANNDLYGESDVWTQEEKYLNVDLLGFWVMARVALDHFEKQRHGHLAAISSISGVCGTGGNPCYSASKAFISTYLEGIKNQMLEKKLPIFTTDVVSGYVSVETFKPTEEDGFYWVSSVEDAAIEICEAIEKKQSVAYVSKKWELIALLLKQNPEARHGLQYIKQLKKYVV